MLSILDSKYFPQGGIEIIVGFQFSFFNLITGSDRKLIVYNTD